MGPSPPSLGTHRSLSGWFLTRINTMYTHLCGLDYAYVCLLVIAWIHVASGCRRKDGWFWLSPFPRWWLLSHSRSTQCFPLRPQPLEVCSQSCIHTHQFSCPNLPHCVDLNKDSPHRHSMLSHQGVTLFERIRRCGLVGGSVSLGVGSESLKPHA